jgi:hypothetical protein
VDYCERGRGATETQQLRDDIAHPNRQTGH